MLPLALIHARAVEQHMALELDHIFICVSQGGEEEAGRLSEFGLVEGPPNEHPGQGTACRRFFFANCYLELLWVCDAEEAQSELARATHLYKRWSKRAGGACPFGFSFRPSSSSDGTVPFSTWKYRPTYLAGPLSIEIGANCNVLTEPMLFSLSFARRPESYPIAKRPPLMHCHNLSEVTRMELVSPYADNLSAEMSSVLNSGLARVRLGADYVVELGFDGELRGESADFRPWIPLLLRW